MIPFDDTSVSPVAAAVDSAATFCGAVPAADTLPIAATAEAGCPQGLVPWPQADTLAASEHAATLWGWVSDWTEKGRETVASADASVSEVFGSASTLAGGGVPDAVTSGILAQAVGFQAVVLLQANSRFVKQLHGKLVGIAVLVHYALYACVYYHFGAYHAGLMSAVQRGAFQHYAQPRRLNYGVLLGVDGIAKLQTGAAGNIVFHTQTLSPFLTAFYPFGGAVVAGGEYAFVFDDYRPYLSVRLVAAGPRSHLLRQLHKPFVPLVHINSAACGSYRPPCVWLCNRPDFLPVPWQRLWPPPAC